MPLGEVFGLELGELDVAKVRNDLILGEFNIPLARLGSEIDRRGEVRPRWKDQRDRSRAGQVHYTNNRASTRKG
jgi:hypothetical protein